MGNLFRGSEIVKIGIQIEKNGKSFYDAVSVKSSNQKAKTTFSFMAKEEERHIESFQKMLSGLKEYKPVESYPGEYEAYLEALSREHVFTGDKISEELLEKADSEAEALYLAIGFEKDSILFFSELSRFVPEADRRVINELIRQEREHLVKLSNLKKEMKA